MTDQPVPQARTEDPASHEQNKPENTGFSFADDVLKPAANVGIEVYNAAANAANLFKSGDGILPKVALYDVQKADFMSPSWWAQTASGGLATAGVLALGSTAVGFGLKGAAQRFALNGAAGEIMTSGQTSLLLAGTAFDGSRDVHEGETRLGNIAGGAASLAIFGQFNRLAAELPITKRLSLQAFGGSTGSLTQLAINNWSQGKSIEQDQFWQALVGGAVTNVAIPALQKGIGDGVKGSISAARSLQTRFASSEAAVPNTSEPITGTVFASARPTVAEPPERVGQPGAEPEHIDDHAQRLLPGWENLSQDQQLKLLKSLDNATVDPDQRDRIMYSAITGDDALVHISALKHLPKINDFDQTSYWQASWNWAHSPAEQRYIMGLLPGLSEPVRRMALNEYFNMRQMKGHAAVAFDTAGDADTRGLPSEARTRIEQDKNKPLTQFLMEATADMSADERRRFFTGIAERSRSIGEKESGPQPLPEPIVPGKEVVAQIRDPMKDTQVSYPAVEYEIPGQPAKLIVGRDLDKHFPAVRRARTEQLAGTVSDESLISPFQDLALPEDHARVMRELPDGRLHDRVIVAAGRGAEPIVEWAQKKWAGGHVYSGDRDSYIHELNYNDWFRTVHFHEWAHRFEWAASPEARRAYDAAAKRETWHLRPYGEEFGENLSVHGGEAMLGPRQTFEDAAKKAPLRSAIFGRMLKQQLIDLPPEMRSTMHGEWQDRIAHLEKHIVPLAQKLAAQELAAARFANQGQTLDMLKYLQSPGKSWLSDLRGRPPVDGLNAGMRELDGRDGALLRAMQVKRLSMRAEDMGKVQAQPYVKALEINGTASEKSGRLYMKPGALSGLANFRSVEDLTIRADDIPAQELNVLSQLPNLRRITIDGDVSPGTMRQLANAKQLEAVQLKTRLAAITRQTLRPLVEIPTVHTLHVGNYIEPGAFAPLGEASGIREFGVNSSRLHDWDMQSLASMPSLNHLLVSSDATFLSPRHIAPSVTQLTVVGDPSKLQQLGLKRLTQLKDVTFVRPATTGQTRFLELKALLPSADVRPFDLQDLPDSSLFAKDAFGPNSLFNKQFYDGKPF